MSDIEFNNFYITEYFKRIDQRRIQKARTNVLPIKNSEIGKFVDLNSTHRTLYREYEGCVWLTLRLFFQFISATFFVCLDWIFCELLDVVARHSRINFFQEGVHNLNITINGTGFIADLVRASIRGFDVHEHIKVLTTNEPCLPRPHLLDSWSIIRIYLLFIFNLYLIYNQVHINRSKLFVCAYFYPKREKQRTLYLYNKMLKRRRDAFKMMEARIKEKFKLHKEIKGRPTNIFKVDQAEIKSRAHIYANLICFSSLFFPESTNSNSQFKLSSVFRFRSSQVFHLPRSASPQADERNYLLPGMR